MIKIVLLLLELYVLNLDYLALYYDRDELSAYGYSESADATLEKELFEVLQDSGAQLSKLRYLVVEGFGSDVRYWEEFRRLERGVVRDQDGFIDGPALPDYLADDTTTPEEGNGEESAIDSS